MDDMGVYLWGFVAPIIVAAYVVLTVGPVLTAWGLRSGATIVTLAGVTIVAAIAGLFILCQVHKRRNEARAMNFRLRQKQKGE